MSALGELLAYPDASLAERLARALREAADGPGPLRDGLEAFAAEAGSTGPRALEELYTRTFDMNPKCSLEVGWHLYGEQYERGAFLVTMRGHMRRLGIAEDHELPDHLSHALAVHARMDAAEADRFAEEALRPALAKIVAGLGDEPGPYRHLLRAVEARLQPRSPR
ncbi:MAG: nitrate reductase molybdenum cofactor assembly chaperone [Elusimicrobia bacterium]|nr:nitrate reductase molybdenum cofactor assembly chaperone [Elusimicrobiota bacterium]